MESDTRWQDWSLTLGFPVMGINADGSDGTDVNAVCRSRDEGLVIVADDSGHVRLFNAPVACRFAAHRATWATRRIAWASGFWPRRHVASCGGRGGGALWKVIDGGDEGGQRVHRATAGGTAGVARGDIRHCARDGHPRRRGRWPGVVRCLSLDRLYGRRASFAPFHVQRSPAWSRQS